MNNSLEYRKQDILISIIVPAFGVVEYISELINSVITQWDDAMELIIINDGSTDGIRSLLKEYEEKINSDNLIIINQENNGVATARNNGVSIARGKYLMFLDGDDFLLENSLKYVKYCLSENHPDCLIIDFNYYFDDGSHFSDSAYKYLKPRNLLHYDESFLKAVYDTKQLYLWRHIFKKEIILKHPQPSGRNFEDISTLPLYIDECDTIYYLPLKIIQYRQRNHSIMRSKTEKNILDLSSSLEMVTLELKRKYKNHLSDGITLSHSIFNLYLFTWACGDTLANKDLSPLKLHPVFVENFHKSNLVPLEVLKKSLLESDKKTWNKFNLFFYNPKIFLFIHKFKYKYSKTYNFLNKMRKKIYDSV